MKKPDLKVKILRILAHEHSDFLCARELIGLFDEEIHEYQEQIKWALFDTGKFTNDELFKFSREHKLTKSQ